MIEMSSPDSRPETLRVQKGIIERLEEILLPLKYEFCKLLSSSKTCTSPSA